MADVTTHSTNIEGRDDHDEVLAQNPVVAGFRANANEPTAVDADDDAVYAWSDRLGRLVVIDGHPNPESPVVINATASGDTVVIATPGAGVSLHIKRVVINNAAAQDRIVFLQQNGTAVNSGGGELASNGGGMILTYGSRGWKLAANTGLDVNLDSTGDVWVSVLEYYIAA